MIYCGIVSTCLPVCKAACCTTSEDRNTQLMLPPPPCFTSVGSSVAWSQSLKSWLWLHQLHILTLPWFSFFFSLLLLETPGWEIVQPCFLLGFWHSGCWKKSARDTCSLQDSVWCPGSIELEEQGTSGSPSLFTGRCLGHEGGHRLCSDLSWIT